MPFIPKNKKKWSKTFKTWSTEIRLYLNKKTGWPPLLVAITTVLLVLYWISSLLSGSSKATPGFPPMHGLFNTEIQSSTPLIFPSVEHHEVLRSLGVQGLFTLRIDMDGNSEYVLKAADPPMTEDEAKELMKTNQKKFVKRSFSDHGRLVYRRQENHPEVVIVTLIDFENYSLKHSVRAVQNRVDYAQSHGYGVYIRWAQEFLPLVQKQNVAESYDFIKTLALRAAINSFPYAKYFWFFDHNGLIMKFDISLQEHLLDPKILELATLKSVPVTGNSNIKTYKHFDTKSAKIIIPKTANGDLDTSSFVVTPSLQGKAFLDYLNDPLVRNYPWPSNLSGAIGHLLQWHPKILQRTAIVVPKTIATVFDPSGKSAEDDNSRFSYVDGDFVVSLSGCELRNSCEQDLETFYSKSIEKEN